MPHDHRLAYLFLAAAAALADPAETPGLRLPPGIQPTRCALDLTVLPASGTLKGKATLELQVKAPTTQIWLNGTGLEVEKVFFTSKDGTTLQGKIRAADRDHLQVQLPSPVVGAGRLEMVYSGRVEMGSDILGPSRQQVGSDIYVHTDFEPAGARKAFPCFDQPDLKTPWRLTLHVPQGCTAYANTPVESQASEPGQMTRFTFQETRPLPSYLVSFAVGPFEVVEAGKGGRKGTPLRIVVPRGLTGQAGFTATAMGPLLRTLEAYFDLPYPYSKLDFVAAPGMGGAMENPGLIVFDPTFILAPPRQATYLFRRGFTFTAAHEMSHQWFGDLVTTSWWDDLWLNEGFAEWMEIKVAGEWQPSWDAPYLASEFRERGMSADALATARKIRQPIEVPSDMTAAFDSITYSKGSAVLAMFEAWMGPEAFRTGIHRYLRAHADGNATKDDFLAALAEQGGKEIPAAFSSFLDQAGLPSVAVDLQPAGPGRLRLQFVQKRYLPVGSTGSTQGLWQIPLTLRYATRGGRTEHARFLLDQRTGNLELPITPDDLEYVVVNEGGQGYYRTFYSEALDARLRAIGDKALTVPERISLLKDTMAAANSLALPVERALGWVPLLAKDPDRHVQEALVEVVQSLDAHLVSTASRQSYRAFIQSTFGPQAHALGLVPRPGEDERLAGLREKMLDLVGGPGQDPWLREEARRLTLAWLKDRTAVDPAAIQSVVQVAAMGGDRALFDSIMSAARHTDDPKDQETLLLALGAFREPALAAEARSLALDEHFHPDRRITLLAAQGRSRAGSEALIDFCRDHFDELARKMPRWFPKDVGFLFTGLDEPADEARALAVLGPYRDRVEGLAKGLEQMQETIRLNAAARSALAPGTARFLHGQVDASKAIAMTGNTRSSSMAH